MNQQQIEESNVAYLNYHRAVESAKLEYFPEIMRELPPMPHWNFTSKIPPTGKSVNMLEYVNGEEMPVGIDLRENEFCILYGKTCTFMEQMVITKVVPTGKFFCKTQDDFKIKSWYQFW